MESGAVAANAVRSADVQQRGSLTKKPRIGEAVLRTTFIACGGFVLATTIAMLGFLARTGIKGIAEVGILSLLTGDVWKPEADQFGGLALIVGTFASAIGATVLGAAPAVLTAVWLTEFAPETARRFHRRVMEIASGVPSVVYGWLALVYLDRAAGTWHLERLYD